MTPEEARRIAYHHLGDMLWLLSELHGQWTVAAADGCPAHEATTATGATVDEAAADCAAQLRAAGWVPTHPRLEWERDFDSFALVLRVGLVRCPLWSGKMYSNDTGWARNDNQASQYNIYPIPKAEIIATLSAWCAANLPSLHLPLFPTDGK